MYRSAYIGLWVVKSKSTGNEIFSSYSYINIQVFNCK